MGLLKWLQRALGSPDQSPATGPSIQTLQQWTPTQRRFPLPEATFSEEAHLALSLANHLANVMAASAISEMHLLAAIAKHKEWMGARAFKAAGISLGQLQLDAVYMSSDAQAAESSAPQLQLDEPLHGSLQRAMKAALLEDTPVRTEHMAIGLAEGGSEALQREMSVSGINADHVRRSVVMLRQLDRADRAITAGNRREAIDGYRMALEVAPAVRYAANNLAWLLSTSPEDDLRSGEEALRLMQWVIDEPDNHTWKYYGTTSAAFAETGQFELAIQWGIRAKDVAMGADEGAWKKTSLDTATGFQFAKVQVESEKYVMILPHSATS